MKMRKAVTALPILLLTFMLTARASASGIITEMSVPQYNSYHAQAEKWRDIVALDERQFFPAFSGAGVLNGRYVIIFRFQPPGTEPVNFNGRHFSVLFDSRSDLIGMMRVRPEWADMERAEQRRAALTAVQFIRRYTPALSRYTRTQLLEERNLEVRRENGQEATIDGQLSIFYDDRRRTYFFVMVAPDGTVMAFERNLPSEAIDFGRAEGNWLYDSYLEDALRKSQENSGVVLP